MAGIDFGNSTVVGDDDDKKTNVDIGQNSSPNPSVAPESTMDTPMVPKIDFGQSTEIEQPPKPGETTFIPQPAPEHVAQPKPDVWAEENPGLDQYARTNAEMAASRMGTPEKVFHTATSGLGMGLQQKILGLVERVKGGDENDIEFAEREVMYLLEKVKEDLPAGGLIEFLGSLFTPGGAGKSVIGTGVRGGAMSAAETEIRNPPSQSGEGVGEAALGGSAVATGLAGAGRAIGGPEAPAGSPTVGSGNIEGGGTQFKQTLAKEYATVKDARKAELEAVIQGSDISFKERPYERLEYHVRSNLETDLANQPANQGLATNVNAEVTPGTMDALDVLQDMSIKNADKEMTLRDFDNVIKRLDRIRPQGAADEAALKVLRDRVESFGAVASFDDMITGTTKLLRDGSAGDLSKYKTANKNTQDYLRISKGTKGAERLLRTVVESGREMDGTDVAKYMYGLTKVGEGKKALGVIEVLQKFPKAQAAYKDGMYEVLTSSGTPTQVSKRINDFLDNHSEVADAMFSPKELKRLNKLRDEAEIMKVAQQAGGKDRSRSKVNRALAAFLATGSTTAAAGAAVAGDVVGRGTVLNTIISEGLKASATPVARQTGETTGEYLDEPAAQGTQKLLEKVPPDPMGARDAIIEQLQGVQ